ncbi:unnamed protein product [Pseudo-nitzschia multistriata]|uniref:Anaphase-promoting complex subunit 11 n=1 Tax=Pseudo-nitzschia multistriata TaxID=183589 RepID=A0A448Z3P8_9STRA|nr:unnamed protein product [Pseudo-nitzschia multistriata]
MDELLDRLRPLALDIKKAFKRQKDFRTEANITKKSKAAAIVESKTMDWTTQAKELDAFFDKQSEQQLKDLPEVPVPSQLKTELLDYQKNWTAMAAPPQSTGIPGTSKVANLHQPHCTLIVCPVSVMSNWQRQIDQHVDEGVLNVGVYQGPSRATLLQKVKEGEINVLLVSYNTLAADYTKIFGKAKDDDGSKIPARPKKKQRPIDSIFKIPFHRICLDEAHIIRNPRSCFFRACNEVSAQRKWAVTGTPFVNKADDIYSLMVFLGYEPLNDMKIYRRAISFPIQNNDEEAGLACLRVAMADVSLRRSKDTAGIQLVDKTVQLTKVSFEEGDPHKAIYDALFGSVRVAFEAVLQNGEKEVLKNYSNIFEKLLRLRQACCSGKLVPLERRQRALTVWNELKQRSNNDQTPKLTAEEGLELLEKLKDAFDTDKNNNNELPECAVCLMEMEEAQCIILKKCSHVYCEDCINRVYTTNLGRSKCPLCRKPFSKSDMIRKSAATAATQIDKREVAIHDDNMRRSPKISALLKIIQAGMHPDEKGVIFSQFTSFLDLISQALQEEGHTFVRMDGSMNTTKRMAAVRAFSSDEKDGPRFILCSLHAAGTGINLTRGSKAFMMDCWWNASVENQAMDRIHRIGQTRPVTIYRLVMKDSLEERIVELQTVKSLQAKGSMQKLGAEEKKKTRLRDLKGLLMIE